MRTKLGNPPDPKSGFDSQNWQTWFYTIFALFGDGNLGNFTVVNLPTTPFNGQQAYATNGRKVGEGVGAGTGVPVYFSNGAWRVFSSDTVVTA